MFRANDKHKQQRIFTAVDQLPVTAEKNLEKSWAQVFYLRTIYNFRSSLSAYEQEHNELFTGYVKEDSLHYCYRVNREELEDRFVQEGKDLSRMLELFEKTHGDEKAYKNAFRVFTEHFRFEQECITLREPKELGGGSLQSPDDEEATFRTKSRESSRGYVANLTETCDDKNELQLINRVTVAPNTTDDQQQLAEDVENLKDREKIDEL